MVLSLLWWAFGIGALVAVYGLFKLPGLLIGLFVGAAVVTASRRKKSPLAVIKMDGVRIDFQTMTMMEGKEEYAIRRIDSDKWERRAISSGALAEIIGRRRSRLSEAEQLDSVETVVRLVNARAPLVELNKAWRSLPLGSDGRRVLAEVINKTVREGWGTKRPTRRPRP